MATATTTTARGFKLICPHCHEQEGTIWMDLADLGNCQCNSCSQDFSTADAIGMLTAELDRWREVARWIETAPELPQD
jgi:uncharacterized protein (DUF983 family)